MKPAARAIVTVSLVLMGPDKMVVRESQVAMPRLIGIDCIHVHWFLLRPSSFVFVRYRLRRLCPVSNSGAPFSGVSRHFQHAVPERPCQLNHTHHFLRTQWS